jgi:Protein of unknown function (DUF4065)
VRVRRFEQKSGLHGSRLLLTPESATISMVIRAKRLPPMVNKRHESHKLTYRVKLPGGQLRLKELILYISQRSADMDRFGLIKLNKVLWRSDFWAFKERGVPVTGRAYPRLALGPAPVEMRPLLAEMTQDGLLEWSSESFGFDPGGQEIIERRPIALVDPVLRWFSADDIGYVDAAIEYYRPMTGIETSDDSHGMAWKSREDLDAMPYEAVFLSDLKPSAAQLRRAAELAQAHGWASR